MFKVKNIATNEDVTNGYFWYISQDGSLWHQPKTSQRGLFKTNMDLFEYFLERSDNSDYVVKPTASPKFPSLKEVKENMIVSKCGSIEEDVYNTIKKLGNFA